jgi:hypothetical protein
MVRDEGREAPAATRLSPLVRLLLWDHSRGSVAYDVAVLLVLVALVLVPGRFWGDPLWVSF